MRGCSPRWGTLGSQMVHFSAIAMIHRGDDSQREGGTFCGHHPGHFCIDEHKYDGGFAYEVWQIKRVIDLVDISHRLTQKTHGILC